jgi:hypothetical protein
MKTFTNTRIEKANAIKAQIDQTAPVAKWGFTAAVWTKVVPGPATLVRVYVNDKKGKAAAILIIADDGEIIAEWQAGHSMTRNELKAAIQEVR